tara:strand:- start:389 stop:1135 length:747 start_codon:yes stop_codon:yes gene_type:complete
MHLFYFLFVGIACTTFASLAFGEGDRVSPPEVAVNFRLLVWAHPKSLNQPLVVSSKTGEPTEVRFNSTFYYREGNTTKKLRLLPGKPSQSISYSGDAKLSFYSNLELVSSPAFSISFDSRWKDVMLLLYPKTSAEKTYSFLPVLRPVGRLGMGVACNLTGNPLYLSVDGRRQRLLSGKPTPFSFTLSPQKDHVRFGVDAAFGSGKKKPILSVKKFFDRNDNPILLLRREAFVDSKGSIKHGKLLLTTL